MTSITPPAVQPPAVQPPPSPRYPPHRGRWIAAIAGVAVLATGLGVGIGVAATSGNNNSAAKQQTGATQSAKQKAPVTHTARPAASVSAPASVKVANDRQLVYWLASKATNTTGVNSAVGGATMRGYVSFQATMAAAQSAAGEPPSPASVTAIPGGYQLADTGNSGITVHTFTAFQHDAIGRVTDLQVDGQAIAPRLAVGPDNTGHLKITGVVAYTPATFNELTIAFKVKNVGGPLANGDFLINFSPTGAGQLEADWQNSPTVPILHPGESASLYAVFGTRTPTGTLTLRSNDQIGTVYASSTLTQP